MMAQASMTNLGQKVLLCGLFVQLLFFGFFLIISLIFWKRMRSSSAVYTVPKSGKHSWQSLLKILFVAAIIIILRCIFRVLEFAQGHHGYLVSHEEFMYLFDALPMLIVQVMFHVIHGGDVFPRNHITGQKMHSESYINLQDRI